MDQQFVCTVLCPYILETVQSQVYDTMYLDFVLNTEIIYITESATHYIHC